MSLLKALEQQHGGRKGLSEKTGIKPDALSHANKGNNVVGYTYKIASKISEEFKIQVIEDGCLITLSKEKI